MSAAAAPRREGRRTRVAAALVLIGLAALAAYAIFSGPTRVPLPVRPQAAPQRTAPAEPGERRAESERD
jgi:hypothetical protein